MTRELSIEQIKSRIRLFVAITLSAVVCISLLGILSERRDTISSAERLAEIYSRALSEHSESAFSEADAILRLLLKELREKGGVERIDQRRFQEEMRRQMVGSPQIGTLFVFDQKGVMRINSDVFPSPPIEVADRAYFQRYLREPGLDLSFSEPLMSRLVHRPRFNLMRPLAPPGGPFQGVMALGFESRYFNRFCDLKGLGVRGEVLLVREDGVPLVSASPIAERNLRQSTLFREKLPSSPFGVYRIERGLAKEEPLIVSYRRLSRFPVIAVVAFNQNDVLAPWSWRALRQSGLTLLLCLVVVGLTRLLFRHLDRLKAAHNLVSGQQAELAIKAAQIDAALDVILQVDGSGRLVHFNRALCRLTGYSHNELAGARLQDLQPPEQAARVPERMAKLKEEGESIFESAYRARDGRIIPVEVHARVMRRDGGTLILGLVRDITQRRRNELRELNRLKVLETIAGDAPLQQLLNSVVRFVEEESPGALCSVLLADESGTRLRHGAAPSLPIEFNRAVDGVPIGKGHGSCGSAAFLKQRVVVEDIEPHPWWKGFQPARDAGVRSCWSEPILSSTGALLGTLAIYHRTPSLPSDEEILLLESAAHLAGIAIDRVRGDESRHLLEEQLRHSQKIEAVGRLAAGVAHDFNNLLTPIIVYAEMLRRGGTTHEQQLKMAESVSQAAQKASELTQKLLSFGRKEVLATASLDLNEVIGSLADIMRSTVRESISIDLRLSPSGTWLQGDRGQLEQVLLNLLVNAQDAIEGTGSIGIETGHLLLDREFVWHKPGIRPGRYVLLAITDDGCGMSEQTLKRIYEPFFTTKETGRGTGLGLSTVYGIVKRHGGYIEVKSRPGKGSRFELYLPEGELPAKEQKPVEGGSFFPAAAGGETILLVEDNAVIREMAGELLEGFGYRVLAAEAPARALQLAAEEKRIDLLATDVILPEMSGPELHDRLRQSHPFLPVLYISGYDHLAPAGFQLDANEAFLAKPFTIEQLLQGVGALLAASGKTGPAGGGET